MAPPTAPTLLIGSCQPFSGKSAVVLGLARQLLRADVPVRFGKPLASAPENGVSSSADGLSGDEPLLDADVCFVGANLRLGDDQLLPSLHSLELSALHRRLLAGELDASDDYARLQGLLASDGPGLNLLEAPGSLVEGLLYGLSLPQLARGLDAPVLLVELWNEGSSVDALLAAREALGERLAGVVLNGVDPDRIGDLRREIVPALERLGIPVLGVMPRSPLLRSVTVEELARRLQAEVLCSHDRLDLLVETLSIGAMNVNSAMEFFRRRRNMAVVTGADRTDIQLAALEASTQCLILTGVGEPLPQLVTRAEELDVPLLKVEHDTLTTVEVIEQAFGHVRLHEAVKATYAVRLVEEHCDFTSLFQRLALPQPVA
ncbi:MAG: phosphotransacetylase family protein [Prochlorococcaceae cyanobacterium]